jgi:hypothetical protein
MYNEWVLAYMSERADLSKSCHNRLIQQYMTMPAAITVLGWFFGIGHSYNTAKHKGKNGAEWYVLFCPACSDFSIIKIKLPK